MTQPALNFSGVPFRGRTPRARHAGYSGSQQAAVTWTGKTARIVAELRKRSQSRQELAGSTGIQINAVCSCLASLVSQGIVVASGEYHAQAWSSGRVTKQERFRVTA